MTIGITSRTLYADQLFRGLELDCILCEDSQFIDCTFLDCSFVETEFKCCRFVNCEFRQCDFSLAKLTGSTFINNRFKGSKIIAVNWAMADWPANELGPKIEFYSSSLNHSTFIGLNLNGIPVVNCQAVNVDFREADLSDSDFSGSDLSDSLFIHTNLTAADLSQARNYSIDPGLNNIKKARFLLPEAMSLLYNMDIILDERPDQLKEWG